MAMNDSKARRGAPAGNAKKRVPWLDSHDLNSPEGAQAFLQEIVKLILTGQIGARQASPLNGTINLLLQVKSYRCLRGESRNLRLGR